MARIEYLGTDDEKARKYISGESKRDVILQRFMEASPQEIGTWIDNNVNDLQSAKQVLKYMGMLIRYLTAKPGADRG